MGKEHTEKYREEKEEVGKNNGQIYRFEERRIKKTKGGETRRQGDSMKFKST